MASLRTAPVLNQGAMNGAPTKSYRAFSVGVAFMRPWPQTVSRIFCRVRIYATRVVRCSELRTNEKSLLFQAGFSNMVGERGFEPPTHWSQTSCATKLRYSPIFYFFTSVTKILPGAKRGT